MLSLKFSRIRSVGRRRHAMRTTSGNRWNAIVLFPARDTLMLEISRQESNEHQISEWSRNHQLRYITAAKLTLNVSGARVFYVQLQSDT